jgi:Ni2+-binding GTPase involved in maturation of urease and hydrogenase
MNQWIAIDNAFDPFEPVPPEKLDAWYVERPYSPLRALHHELHPDRSQKRIILVGHPSSGKSTELTKLAAELGDNYFVVRIDLDKNLNIERANPVEVIFLMGAAIFKVAETQLDHKPDKSLFEQLTRGLETLVQTHTANKEFSINVSELLTNLVCFGAGVLAGPIGKAVADVVTKVIPPFTFVSGTDKEVVRKLEVEPKIEALLEVLNGMVADVEAKAGKPLALIVDGLDKPYDPDIIALNFAEKNYLAKPRCRVIYVAPMWVYYMPRFAVVRRRFPVREFPNIKLYDRKTGKKDNQGYAAMREVVYKRLTSLELAPSEVIAKPVLDLLIHASGGVMRDLIYLFRETALKADIAGATRITKSQAEKAAAALRRQFEAQLRPKYRKILEQVHQSHQIPDDPLCDELLQGNFILSYVNEEVWFDTHSILWPSEAKPQATKKRRK